MRQGAACDYKVPKRSAYNETRDRFAIYSDQSHLLPLESPRL